MHDDLTNALELHPDVLQRANPHGVALDLVQALHQHTATQVQQYDTRAVVRRQRLLGLPWCGVLLLTAGLVTLLQPHLLGESLRIMLSPLSYLPPREIHIAITPAQVTIAQGTNLEVRAQASGRLPRTMHMLVKRPGQDDKHYPMELVEPGSFRYTFLKPPSSFAFYATAGGFTSPPGRVEVVPSPAIGKLSLLYVFPNYTGLPPRTQEGGGDIQALPGTQVQLTMQANVPLTHGVLRFDDGSELPLDITETALRGEILVMKDGTYIVEVEDTHGLKNLQPPRYSVHILPDHHPTVTHPAAVKRDWKSMKRLCCRSSMTPRTTSVYRMPRWCTLGREVLNGGFPCGVGALITARRKKRLPGICSSGPCQPVIPCNFISRSTTTTQFPARKKACRRR